MGKRIIFATGNADKMREVRMILADCDYEIVSMKEAGVKVQIEENGADFAENARIKARAVAEVTGEAAMADDSGLVIDALGGAPGVHSARFMGENTSYTIKNAAILEKLRQVPEEKRTARFVCAIACVLPDGTVLESSGVMEGIIGRESRGENGFGYDPIFYLPQFGCSSAELSPEKKNELSHRGIALRKMEEILRMRRGRG